jgi:hypothetical protein
LRNAGPHLAAAVGVGGARPHPRAHGAIETDPQVRRSAPGGQAGSSGGNSPRAFALDPDLKPEFVSLEGYLSGRLVAAALQMSGPDPTRADMLRLITDVGRFDISGNIMTFGPKAQDVPPKVFLAVIQPDGTFKAVEKL